MEIFNRGCKLKFINLVEGWRNFLLKLIDVIFGYLEDIECLIRVKLGV